MKWPHENMGKFEVTLNYPLHITDDIFAIKEHGKRVLLEMVDTHPKLILAYSGGVDSVFILCCIRDLIDEGKITKNTIEIVQGIFTFQPSSMTAKGIILTSDHERATKFANSLNLNPRIYEYNVNKNWDDIEEFILDMQLSGVGCVNSSCQYLLCMKQDGVVIQHRGPGRYTGLSFDNENLIFSNNWCAWDVIDNIINFDTWDKEIYSSFITPFRLTSRPINTQPYGFGGSDMDERTLVRIQKYLHKFILYFQCYPEMTEIFGKFVTIDWGIWTRHFADTHKRIQKFRRAADQGPDNFAYVKLPNGDKFTKKDLVNYGEYFDVS